MYHDAVLSAEAFNRLVADQAASDEPRSGLALESGLLTVFGTISTFFLLGRDGHVLIDRDEGVLHPANPQEQEFAHIQAARRYPELRHLMPERPTTARTCPTCAGSGEMTFNNERDVICCLTCNTRGWTAET